ncbi:capsid protein [Anaerococcus sp. mt242]|uniref:capsid protein n=1 Tax=Anaerococcus sp. mt242 TaxID=2661917 RepID=UPI001931B7D5|nr:capsid protein [Anaerococcus sp. mt242]MBM0046865.1 capsid protein [Anaerococcus sp. mt242]
MAVKIYDMQFVKTVADIFETRQHFFRTFGGSLQTAAGAEYDKDFLKLKISDTDVVIQDYSTDPNVAFESGTANSSRFGPRHEIKSTDATVGYDKPLALHEGIDNFTVNDNASQVLADRTGLHAIEWIEQLNVYMSKLLSKNAGKTLTTSLTEDAVTNLFYEARKEFVNMKVAKNITWMAYVTPELYNLLIDSKLATTAKNSSANIDEQEIYKFKGFVLEELPEEYFQEGDVAIFVPDNIGVVGIGLQTYRILDATDFYGVTIQGAGQTASYIPEKNKKAIIKAQVGA